MSSPDQHGSAGQTDSESSVESTGYGHHRYASTSSAARQSYNFYNHPARTSILDNSGGLLLDSSLPHESAGQSVPGDAEHAAYHDMENMWESSGNLPSFSRAFDIFSAVQDADAAAADGIEDRFFVPTYLQSSTYVQKLQEAHRTKVQAQREAKRSKTQASDLRKPASGPAPPPPSATHLGMLHRVMERPPKVEEDERMAPLPTKWNKDDMRSTLDLHPDGLGLRYCHVRGQHERDHDASAARADHYMPPQCGIYYFEVRILAGNREDITIAVGFSTKAASMSRPIGWEPESWGYHGDDGRCFTGQNIGRAYGPKFKAGDVIGCGVNFRDRTAFFTRNGIKLDTAFHDVKGKLYPSVSLKKVNEEIVVNFGQEPFIFDIDQWMNGERAKIMEDIEHTETTQLEPDMTESDLIQSLVLQFLQHEGYVETARAFATDLKLQREALNLNPEVPVPGINIRDDEDANNRQRIRRAILEGDIDRALTLTDAYYPQVLRENETVYFRLRCRKFIELVLKAAKLGITCEKKEGHGRSGSVQDMDLDENRFWGDNTMEQDGGDQAELARMEMSMLEYGQMLQAEYANDSRKEINKALSDIWALVAYRNPLKEPHMSHLLDSRGRTMVAEELNSAILSSLGKSSRAALEKIFAQTSVLLDDLRQDGSAGAFVSIQGVVDTVQQFSPM